ncbi:MAG TPA: ATP-binding protein [Elainellaceae cyanobacterium]
MKATTAVISIMTGIELIQVLPKALALTSPAQLEAANQALEKQIDERHQVEENLLKSAEKLQQALEFESLLKRITDKVRDSLDEEQILQAAIRELGQGLGVKSCNAALYDLQAGTATVCYEHAQSTGLVQGRVMNMRNSPPIYRQLLGGQYFQYCSIQPNPARGRVAMLACPIIDDQGVLGDLWLINGPDYGFRDLELRLVQQVANQCAIAIRQARLYQAAHTQVQELTRLNQLKDDFLSTVSHELRTPVANIKVASRMLELALGQSPLLKSGDAPIATPSGLTDKVTQYLKILQNECQREIHLIEDLLDLRRFDEGQHVLEFSPIDLCSWLTQLLTPFEARTRNRCQYLAVQMDCSEPLMIESDEDSLGRILTELLHNACKYTPPGERIAMRVNTNAEQVSFTISNSGVEISSKEIPHIFEKFYRIPSADPWKQGGTGLGLALVQKLVDSLSGTIQVHSEANQTHFTVTLPRSRAIAMAQVPSPQSTQFDLETLLVER